MTLEELNAKKVEAEIEKLSVETRNIVDLKALGAKKTEAEIEKLSEETRNLKKTRFMRFIEHVNPTVIAVVGLAGVIGTVTQYVNVKETNREIGQVRTTNGELSKTIEDLAAKLKTISSLTDRMPVSSSPTPGDTPSNNTKGGTDNKSIKNIADEALNSIPGILLASINVNNTALPGEEWRASQNFSIALPAGTKKLIFQVSGSSASNLSFSIAQDKAFAPDPQLATNIRSESVIDAFSGQNLYIGGVINAPRPFTVNIYAK